MSLSQGAQESLLLAAEHPERVLGAVYLGPALPIEPGHPERHEARPSASSTPTRTAPEGWDR